MLYLIEINLCNLHILFSLEKKKYNLEEVSSNEIASESHTISNLLQLPILTRSIKQY